MQKEKEYFYEEITREQSLSRNLGLSASVSVASGQISPECSQDHKSRVFYYVNTDKPSFDM